MQPPSLEAMPQTCHSPLRPRGRQRHLRSPANRAMRRAPARRARREAGHNGQVQAGAFLDLNAIRDGAARRPCCRPTTALRSSCRVPRRSGGQAVGDQPPLPAGSMWEPRMIAPPLMALRCLASLPQVLARPAYHVAPPARLPPARVGGSALGWADVAPTCLLQARGRGMAGVDGCWWARLASWRGLERQLWTAKAAGWCA
jgi:hypothetical protein